jgi:hypothetical protein
VGGQDHCGGAVMNTKAVLVVGNLVEGFKFIGPFDSFNDAAAYNELHYGGVSWVAELEEVESVEQE